MALINELWNVIEQNPSAIAARKLLMEQWVKAGWLDAAADTAREVLKLDPSDADAQSILRDIPNNTANQSPVPPGPLAQQPVAQQHTKLGALALSRRPEDWIALEQELSEGYEAIRARAKLLLQETRLLRDLQRQAGNLAPNENRIQDLKALMDGRISAVVSTPPPPSARAVARGMEADREHALDTAVKDLVDVVRWLRSSTDQDMDSMRQALTKRVRAMVAALPEDELQQYPSTALMHVEHEELKRSYVNNETMYGDAIEDIPRENFWASEDGYAWDMEELAACLASNGAVMRNPLSRKLFSQDDVRAIVQHPLGKQLAPMRLEQSKLSQGVRPATIDKLENLSATLLADMSDNQITSRHAIDDFLSHVAVLPQAEQQAIDRLQVPATDSHTGQAFDCTIGEAVRDAQANKICLHKTGDLIGQAARYLRTLAKP